MSRPRLYAAFILTSILSLDTSLFAQPSATRELIVHAASFHETASGAEGTTHPVLIRLEPSRLGIVQVGLFETGAIGPQWRAAGWMAAPVASSLADDVSVSPQDRLTALPLYWGTTLHARLLRQLATAP